MERQSPRYCDDVETCVDHIIDYFDKDIKIESPLGLGKPVALLNALYRRAKQDPQIKLTIISALSLEKPDWSNELQKRFIKPFADRVWCGVPDLLYLKDLRTDAVPPNVTLYEYYCGSGRYAARPQLQQHHICANHTHIARNAEIIGANLFANMIAKSAAPKQRCLSMSCNADLALQTLARYKNARKNGGKGLCIGQINSNLPFMYGDAEVRPESYDIIIENPKYDHPLFAVPRQPVSMADYMIGMKVSTLITDGGTLQMGFGAFGDAVAYALDMRHNFNSVYKQFIKQDESALQHAELIETYGGTDPFKKGLYGATEILVDGYLQLYKSGVLKRKVYHHSGIQRLLNQQKIAEELTPDTLATLMAEKAVAPYLTRKEFNALQGIGIFKAGLTYENGWIKNGGKTFSANLNDAANLKNLSRHCLGDQLKNGVILTGGFFIGPEDFYETLRNMPEEERRQFEMTGFDVANQLYGDEKLRSLQRKDGRFCNTGMKATLLGHIVSDGLEDGTVISGVGGQYNFVSMSHALPDARLIVMLRSTRTEKGRLTSNILYNYGNVTIPRHLRDIIITEYGIADLRGKCDKDVILSMLNITDSRFQGSLLRRAKKHRKIPQDYRIPDPYRSNVPERLVNIFQPFKTKGYFIEFPHGTDLSPIEFGIARSLQILQQKLSANKLHVLANLLKEIPLKAPERAMIFLERMQLATPKSFQERMMQKTLILSLRLADLI